MRDAVIVDSKAEARKKVREAQAKANEARIERERHNVDDAASLSVRWASRWPDLGTRIRAVECP